MTVPSKTDMSDFGVRSSDRNETNYAHYYDSRRRKWIEIHKGLGRDSRFVFRGDVKGRREARRIAAEHGAICWNF